ncbi:MAG: TonB-dependent receptor, partial [Cyclobacteriaceae bacterium]|nr:TonB-dependent receptor [Cyclobacteriaceae bacterium]
MIARLIYLFIFSLISFSSLAQQFKGKVLDKETNEPIPFADVFFMELQTGTSTDENGIFVLDDLLNSKIHIQISFMGYKTLHEEIDINEIHEKIFYIEPSHIDLEEVVFSVPGGKLQGENIVSIERKNLSQIEHSSITLAEAISNIPGVDQNTTGTGIGKPVIRGLSGNRIVTYAQGIRIENQQWG